ncbi:hypothetical protein JTE90_024763 [Oedothorax gibbosus]|uniref:ARF7 effector protein C-terminal domain-containing protein n=1 Tax=Oedothorax gibbosus TaxID=931172 RepID=A0AAV6UAF9_9ARAC|nr:hypothetical protein JTE90_024763 [Oedothorax gibbosus]
MFKLAPTAAASKQNSFRTYHQVQQWLNEKNPLKWGWKKVGERLRPIATACPADLEELLSLIACVCKDECVRNCRCRKSGLNCSNICSNCSGLGCDKRDTNIRNEDLEVDGD